ncbi:hypothetical protein D3C73_1316680 [compost metagenome]
MIGNCAFHIYIAACDRCSRHVGACFNPVRDDMMFYAMQALNAFNPDDACSCTADNAAHAVQVVGQINNLRLLGGILNHRNAFSKRCGHHYIFSCAYAGHIQIHFGSAQPPV